MFSDFTFFPGDFRMCEVGNYGGNGSGDEIRKPDKIIVFNDEVGQNCEKSVIKKCDQDAYYKVTKSVFRSFDIFLWRRFFGRLFF